MRSLLRAAVVVAAGLLAPALTAAAQAQPDLQEPQRPRIGLALGGGSARGLAHVGVLTWLDEHRIPVDVIAGTSMGALIGSTMATGMTPDEAWAMLAATDWAGMLAPDSPFRDKTFRRKEDARAFPSVLQFGLKHGFTLPTGFSPAQQASLLFDRVALPYAELTRFSDLPIPFACVATDLRTSTAVVLDAGRLDEALRATMAIPGLFMPVRIGDHVLVDGGILNNVPADVVKTMGADIVIAVDVGRDLNRPKKSGTLFEVLAETLDVVMRAPLIDVLASADLVITPDLRDLTGAHFGRVTEFVNRGYDAAEAHRDRLLPYALSVDDYQAHLAARTARRRTRVPTPQFLTIEGVSGAQKAVIRRQLRRHVGHPIDADALERDLTLLTGSDRYDTITYRIGTAGGRQGLIVTAREKTYAPPYLDAALDIRNAESSTVSAALRGRLTFFDVLTPGSETRLDLGLGQTTHAGAEWFLAIGSRGFFMAPRASYTRHYENLFANDEFMAEYKRETRTGAIDLGYTSGRSLELRAGYVWERVDGAVRLGEPLLPEVSGRQGYWRAQITFDGQSSPVVPRRGLYARASLRRFTDSVRIEDPDTLVASREPDDMMIADIQTSYFTPVSRRGRVFVSGGAGWSFHDRTSLNAFTLGGPLELGALRRDALRGSNFAVGSVGYLHEVARIVEGVVGRLYAGAWVENGTAFERVAEAQLHTNVSGGFIMETVVGPAFVLGSVGTDGKSRVYIGLGPIFRR
jgi:NTE family protein